MKREQKENLHLSIDCYGYPASLSTCSLENENLHLAKPVEQENQTSKRVIWVEHRTDDILQILFPKRACRQLKHKIRHIVKEYEIEMVCCWHVRKTHLYDQLKGVNRE